MLSRFMTRREQFVLVFFASAIFVGCAVAILKQPAPDDPVVIPADPESVAPILEPEVNEAAPRPTVSERVVSVQGAVRLPGVYRFDSSQRVMDAIEEAGGLSDAADASSLNLAAPLVDGTTIVVPAKDATLQTISHSSYLQSTASPSGIPTVASPGTPGQKININTATQVELETLPGIGPAYASAIIQRRDQAPFESVEELLEVRGIGEKRLEGIRELVTVQ